MNSFRSTFRGLPKKEGARPAGGQRRRDLLAICGGFLQAKRAGAAETRARGSVFLGYAAIIRTHKYAAKVMMKEASSGSNQKVSRALRFACVRFLQVALWRQGASSNDIVDSMADDLALKVSHLAEWCDEQRQDADILTRAVDHLRIHHDGPWRGAEWFVNALTILIEIAVPNTGHDEMTVAFLRDLQVGIGQSIQQAPASRAETRITDDIARDIQRLKETAASNPLVADLLNLSEALLHGRSLDEEQSRLLLVAGTAAPFSRQNRSGRAVN